MLNIIDIEARGIQTIELPALLTSGNCKKCDQYSPEPGLDGQLLVDPDIQLSSPGEDLLICPMYAAPSTNNGPYGYGRSIAPIDTLVANSLDISIYRGDGAVVAFNASAPPAIQQPINPMTTMIPHDPVTPGVLSTVLLSNGVYCEQSPNGKVTAFPALPNGQLSSMQYIRDSVGNTKTLTYSAGLVQSIEDPIGRKTTFLYNSSNLLETIEDWAGRRTTFGYDTTTAAPRNLLTSITGPTGCVSEYQFTTFTLSTSIVPAGYDWLMSGIVDPNGYGTSYTFDTMRRVTSRTVAGIGTWSYQYGTGTMTTVDPLGRVVTQTVDANSQMTRLEDAGGNVMTFTRNANTQETSRTNPLGARMTTTYDSYGNVISVVDPSGHITTRAYDSYNNPISIHNPDGTIVTNIWAYASSSFDTTGSKKRLQAQVDPLGNITSHFYNSYGLMTGVEDPLGNRTTFGYDLNGNRITTQDPLGRVTSYTHDLAGNVLTTMDPLGNVWSQTYDAQNRPLTSTDPLGNTTTNAYDSVGNMVVQIDPMGNRTSWTFNVFDLPVSQTDALGNTTTNVYDITGKLIAQMDALGNTTTTIYSNTNRPVALIDPLGNRSTQIYNSLGVAIASMDPLGNLTTTVFDSSSRAIAQIDSLGNVSSTIYDSMGRVVASVDPLGHANTTVYDLAGRTIAQIDALGNHTSMAYDSASRRISMQNALGYLTTYLHDAAGETVGVVDPLGYHATSIYDAVGRQIAYVDPRGYISSTIFDAAGRSIASINALSQRNTTIYDALNRPVANVDALGYTITTLYDALSRTIATVDALGNRNTTLYDAASRVIAQQDALGYLSTNLYDAASRTVATVSPLSYRASMFYDAASRMVAQQDALGYLSTSVYDADGRIVADIDPLGYMATTLYDAAGRSVAQLDPLGNRTTSLYDAANRTIAMQDANGYFTTFLLDAVGQRLAVIDANSHRTTSTYDARGSMLTQQDPLGALTSFQFDASRNVLTRTDARGYLTAYTYDPLNREVGRLYPDSSRVTHTFDAAGRLITQQDSLGIRSMSYDANNREISVLYPTGIALTQSFNAVGNRVQLQDSGGMTTYLWDAENRLTGIINPLAESTTLTYDALSRQQTCMMANGVSTSNTYDAAGRETSRSSYGPTGVVLAMYTNTYDAASNRVGVTELNGTRLTFMYDSTYQLINEQRNGSTFGATISTGLNAYDINYTYDSCGNRLIQNHNGQLTTSTYNAANELVAQLSPNGIPVTSIYDANGNLLIQQAGTALTTLTWDFENRLSCKTDNSSVVETNTYSADGLRQSRERLAPITVNTLDAQFISQEVPPIMVAGGTYGVSITMRNNSTTVWTAEAEFRLGSENPEDNSTWGRGRVYLPYRVECGAEVTFNFTITAPTTAGSYNFQWQMLQEGVAHFGDLTANISVGVYANPLGNQAQWIAQNIPSNMIAGESYCVSVSMKNIGSTTWMPTTLHNLGSQDPEDNEMWGMGRVVMPIASAAPGVTVEFVWTVTAPLTPGSYAFQWEMVQDGVEHFGDFSPLVTVTVAASELGVPDGLLNAVWDSDNLLLELDGALSTTGRYTDSPGMWGGLVSEWQSAQLIDSWDAAGSSFYGYDSQSCTRLLTNASGTVTDNYAYRAFGTEWQSGNGSRNSYRYEGQYGYYRERAAIQYVRARYLDVQAGRWVSRDPIGYDGGDWNLYRYVGNESVGRIDASGHHAIDPKTGCWADTYTDKSQDNTKNHYKNFIIYYNKFLAALSKCVPASYLKAMATAYTCIAEAESSFDSRSNSPHGYGLMQLDYDHYKVCTKHKKICNVDGQIETSIGIMQKLCTSKHSFWYPLYRYWGTVEGQNQQFTNCISLHGVALSDLTNIPCKCLKCKACKTWR